MATGCVWLVCARGAGGGWRSRRVFCVPAWTAHLSSPSNPVNRGPRWTFSGQKACGSLRTALSSRALVCVRRPCRVLLLPEGLPHLHLLRSLLLEQPRSARLNQSLCMYLSSLFSSLCLLALLPGRVPRAYFSSLPPSRCTSPRAHSSVLSFLLVVTCMCVVIAYLTSLDVKLVFHFLPVCTLPFHTCFCPFGICLS